jgi:photosystem II stability/assembly factor-like uncharacterized protein
MNNKTFTYLILIITPLFSACRGSVVKENENKASATFVSSKPIGNLTTSSDVEPSVNNVILQSADGGETWQDISQGLPENQEIEDFFAGESAVYLRVKDGLYSSKSNLPTPVWEKENVPGLQYASIVFNRSGVMAYNYGGQVYRKIPATGNWLPMYTNLEKNGMRTVFETADGVVFVGRDDGFYKSADKGLSWNHVQNEGLVMGVVESEGVLIGTSPRGIMRSTDNGEHWESVISEGGVGIAVERFDGGFAAISYNTTTQSRRIRVSLDKGKTWTAIDEGLQSSASISSIKQVGNYLLCGHPDGIFRSSDMGKTWSIVYPRAADNLFIIPVGIGNNGRVFKLYVSGKVLYAVARSAGC